MILPEDREGAVREYRVQDLHNRIQEIEYRVQMRDGRIAWVLDKTREGFTEDGRGCLYTALIDF